MPCVLLGMEFFFYFVIIIVTIPQISSQARGPIAATAYNAGCGPS
jgi:hypothetical protein